MITWLLEVGSNWSRCACHTMPRWKVLTNYMSDKLLAIQSPLWGEPSSLSMLGSQHHSYALISLSGRTGWSYPWPNKHENAMSAYNNIMNLDHIRAAAYRRDSTRAIWLNASEPNQAISPSRFFPRVHCVHLQMVESGEAMYKYITPFSTPPSPPFLKGSDKNGVLCRVNTGFAHGGWTDSLGGSSGVKWHQPRGVSQTVEPEVALFPPSLDSDLFWYTKDL